MRTLLLALLLPACTDYAPPVPAPVPVPVPVPTPVVDVDDEPECRTHADCVLGFCLDCVCVPNATHYAPCEVE